MSKAGSRPKGQKNVRAWVGVDIGSSAVRAAEVVTDGSRRMLRRFAQVDLDRGVVVDGEVVNVPTVGEALRRLWDEGKFSTRRVVVGVSSQRVIVRPAEVAAMPAEDFRLALQFEAQELIPMPVEDAVLDFSILQEWTDTDAATGNQRMRILLAAAHREMIQGHLQALKLANLDAVAVDLMPLALLRAVPEDRSSPGGTDAVVSVGSDLTTVAIREDGAPRFARTFGLGGSKVTNSIATDLAYDTAEAETLKRNGNAPVQVAERVRSLVATEIANLVNEINSSLDYYLAQSDRMAVDRVVVTGGGSLTQGLLQALQRHVGSSVSLANPVDRLVVEETGMGGALAPQALAAIGLALWGLEAPSRQLTLLPREVLLARRQKRVTRYVAAGLVGLGVVLGGAWGLRQVQISSVDHQVAHYTSANDALQARVSTYSDITDMQVAIASRRAAAEKALGGTVDWLRLLGQIAAVLPPGESLTTFSGSGDAGTEAAKPGDLGTISMTITGQSGQESVAEWLRALDQIPSLSDVTVSGSSSNGPIDTFSSTATVNSAGATNRQQGLPGAGHP